MTTMHRALTQRAAALHALVLATAAPALAAARPAGDAHLALPMGAPAAPVQPAVPASIIAWLAKAALLYGMPFEYITPDGRMLPKEAMRFFYVDANWQNSLIDGAVSIGLSSSADSIQTMAAIQTLVAQAIGQTAGVRESLRTSSPAAADTVTTGPITGVLLRSAIVSGWPGVEVSAYSDDAATQPLRLLRLDRLSDDVLIGLFDGLPRVVNFLQPPEGLHFGVRPGQAPYPPYYSFLRGLGYGGHAAGLQIPGVTAAVTMRAGAKAGVLDVAASAASVKAALQGQGALDPSGTFTAAEFAVQMVRAAGMQSFQWTTPASAEATS